MIGKMENTKKAFHLPVIAVILGLISIFFALGIGYIAFRYSMISAEKGYHNFYLRCAKDLASLAKSNKNLPPKKLLKKISRHWKSASNKPPDEYICIVNGRSELIFHSAHPGTVGNNAGDNILQDQKGRRVCKLSDIVADKQDYVGRYVSSTGQEQIAAFAYIPERNWTLGVHRSKDAVLEEVKKHFLLLNIGFLVVCGVLMPLSFGLLYRTFAISQKNIRKAQEEIKAANVDLQQAVTELEAKNREVEAQNKEKGILLKEIHHRVKNNMQIISSLLNLQEELISDERDIELFRESKNRVFSMALIHEKLYQSENLSQVDFGKYLQNLMERLIATYIWSDGGDYPEVTIDTGGIFIGVDIAIPCALIVNELVSNSLKYAFSELKDGKNTIDITFNRENANGTYSLMVADNGTGLPHSVDFKNTKSLGLELVNMLTSQLNGEIDLDNTSGARFKITFPIPSPVLS
jgi:two-component sensor histidine kinase